MKLRLLIPFPPSLILVAMLAGCGTDPAASTAPRYLAGIRGEGNQFGLGRDDKDTSLVMKKDTVSYWDGDGVTGPPSIVINLSQQRAYFFKGKHLVGVSLVSTGTEGMNTPSGDYKIIQKSENHESNLYGDYVYPDGTIARKDVDTKRDPKPPGTRFDGTDMPYFMRFHGGYGLHAGYLPGFPASHGCVRMPIRMAKIYFENVEKGTPVKVIH